MYGEADVYLLDDPLSAVDPQVEHHLFEECIRKLMKNCAVVLVTHQLPIAQISDKVMVMKEVRIAMFNCFLAIQCAGTWPRNWHYSHLHTTSLKGMDACHFE